MPGERSRSLEIDGSDEPGLDARSIVLGGGCREHAEPPPVDQPTAPSVVWEGQVRGDGTGPQKSYFVRLYSDGTAHCQCPAFVRYVLPKARLVRASPVRCGTAG